MKGFLPSMYNSYLTMYLEKPTVRSSCIQGPPTLASKGCDPTWHQYNKLQHPPFASNSWFAYFHLDAHEDDVHRGCWIRYADVTPLGRGGGDVITLYGPTKNKTNMLEHI